MSKVGFVGIGVMGAPMARNLIKGGFEVAAYDVNTQAMQSLAGDGARMATSPKDAATGADHVISMLPVGDNVKEAVFGENGIAAGLSKGGLYIDMSTILPSDTDEIGRGLKERGIAMVDAPVGRLSSNAVAGTLLIMAGGDAKDIERARPLFEKLGDTIIHCGPLGSGTRMKIANNYLSTSLNVLSAEALTLAESMGLDVKLTIEVLNGTTAGRGHLSTTYPAKVLQGDVSPGFMINHANKDLGLALETAAERQVPVTLGAAARQFYSIARKQGRGRDDWTVLYRVMREMAGLD